MADTNLLLLGFIAVLVILLSVLAGGGLIALVATWISRFLSLNAPSAEVMAQFNAAEAVQREKNRSIRPMQNQAITDDNPETDDEAVDSSDGLLCALGSASRYVALLAAWVATCGSLYMSEVLGWVPCLLCWYQRILMYPLSLILAVGLLRRDKGLYKYALALSIPGACVSLFHYLDQKTDLVAAYVPCKVGVPCSVDYLNAFGGVVTIPFLAGTAFLIITFCMVASRLGGSADDVEEDSETGKRSNLTSRIMNALPVFAIIAAVVLAFAIAANSFRNAAASSVPAPAAQATVQVLPTADTAALARGKVLFNQSCAVCHGLNAEGTPAGRALTDSQLVRQGSDTDLAKFVRMGRAAQDPHNTTGLVMPANGGVSDLSEQDIAAVISYMRRLTKTAS